MKQEIAVNYVTLHDQACYNHFSGSSFSSQDWSLEISVNILAYSHNKCTKDQLCFYNSAINDVKSDHGLQPNVLD